MKLLISLHDVTPFHLSRLSKAEALFQEMGLRKITYLFIPNYHGRNSSSEHPEFKAWCHGARALQVQWHLHGDQHLEAVSPARDGVVPWTDRLRRRFLTAGEGEFLSLDSATQWNKLNSGREAFRHCLGEDPTGFVPPAWLSNSSLPPLLKEFGFQYTEDRHRIFSLGTDKSVRSPVITWATRTPLLKYASIAAAPILSHVWRTAEVLRVAIHPFDFDHDQTVASIRNVLSTVLPDRQQCFCEELEFGPADSA